MVRNPVRDERQGDLFGAPPPPDKPVASPPKPAPAKAMAPEAVSMGKLGAKVMRPEIDEFLNSLPDQELAYLVVEATRLVKRRFTRGQGRGLRLNGGGCGRSSFDDALRRIAGELMEFENPGEAW